MIEPYPENVDGDFYVEKDCCTMCDIPMAEAPDLFTYAVDSDGGPDHCYVSRQPKGDAELSDMLSVIQCAEFRCVRYRGSDPDLLQRLVDLGESDICDAVPSEEIGKPSKSWWRFW
ncbi:hypothetical protein [Neorhodopirellula lusitana]|uniref:hypothetical protein n=1 Tax=Neorhodopirellula lusitana TaxID=445327 RepID=UPI00384C9F74